MHMSAVTAPNNTTAAPRAGGLPYKYQVAIVVVFGAFIAVLDTDIVNVAIPKLQAVFGVDLNTAQWVINGYTLALTASVPFFGWLADRIGTKVTFLLTVAGFTVASVLCGISWSASVLIAARVLQGLAGGAILPLGITLIYSVFAPEERGSALALLGVPILFAPALGPTVGGYFVDKLDWRLNFLVNVPIGLTCVILGILILREGETKPDSRLDVPGLICAVCGFVSVTYGTTKAESDGWDATVTRGFLGVGALFLTALVFIELRTPDPLLDFRLLKDRAFSGGLIVGALLQACLFGALFLLPLFLQNLRGETAYQTGLILLPSALVTVVALPIAGKLSDMIGAKPMVLFGLLALVTASYLISHLSLQTPLGEMQIWLSIRSVALACCIQPVQVATFANIPAEMLARASAFSNVLQRVVTAVGITYLTTNLGQQEKVHFAHLAERVTVLSPLGQQLSGAVQQAAFLGQDTKLAQVDAVRQVIGYLQAQAAILAYRDTFWIITFLAAFSTFVAIVLLPNARPEPGRPMMME